MKESKQAVKTVNCFLYNTIVQPWTDYFSFRIKLNTFTSVFFAFVLKMSTPKRKRNLLDLRHKRAIVEITKIENPKNNEIWVAVRHRYIGKWCPPVTSTFWTLMKK